jgi:Arc/MetJ-type ribon-helix-helix transcriptional regulator
MPRNGREQINIAVQPEVKTEWEDAIEETGRYESMTQLIRDSVENELIRIGFKEGITEDIPSGGSQSVDVDLGGIEDEIAEMKDELRGVSQRIERISLATDAQQDTELMDLASELHDELPRVADPESLSEESPTDSGAWEGQPWRLAQDVDEPEYDVTRALALLEQQMSRVKSTTVIVDGSPHNVYYVQQ